MDPFHRATLNHIADAADAISTFKLSLAHSFRKSLATLGAYKCAPIRQKAYQINNYWHRKQCVLVHIGKWRSITSNGFYAINKHVWHTNPTMFLSRGMNPRSYGFFSSIQLNSSSVTGYCARMSARFDLGVILRGWNHTYCLDKNE